LRENRNLGELRIPRGESNKNALIRKRRRKVGVRYGVWDEEISAVGMHCPARGQDLHPG